MLSLKKINTIIIDDEPGAIDLLEMVLTNVAEINNLQSFLSADAALDYLAGNMDMDMIFLDIEMPGKNGFDFLEELIKFPISPYIVFTTGFDKYALRAIKAEAFDYFLKPVSTDDIRRIVRRYKISTATNDKKPGYQNLLNRVDPVKMLKFNNLDGAFLVHPEDIVYIKSSGNYSHIHQIGGDQELVTMQLGKIEKTLPVNQYFRISRQIIINLRFLKRVNTQSNLCIIKYDHQEITFDGSGKKLKKLVAMP